MHDPNHYTGSTLRLYGKEYIDIEPSIVSGRWIKYQVEPTEVNHINQGNNPCIEEKNNRTDIWDCITDHMYSTMNCTLPWKMKTSDPLCSFSEEYDIFWSETMNALSHTTNYIEKVAKCIPGCRRLEYSAKLQGSGQIEFTSAAQASGKTDYSDEIELQLYFAKDKFLVKEQFYIYDIADLLADFGGYLGLFLGYSLLGFYEPLMDLIEYLTKICKKTCKKRPK